MVLAAARNPAEHLTQRLVANGEEVNLYRTFRSQEEIDANYRTDIGLDLPSLMRRYAAESARVRQEMPCRLGLKYGPTRAESLDFFPGRPG